MKRFKIAIAGILCMSMLFFSGAATHVDAAELPNTQAENTVVDTRPDYTVYVNRALNCITIKQHNEDGTETPVKAMVCSCGREGHGTPEGTFQTSDYYEWRKMVDNTYGRYAVRFNKDPLPFRTIYRNIP